MNEKNLKPLGSGALTPEEERAIRQAGGRASQEARKKKKYAAQMQEKLQALLAMPCKKGQVKKASSLEDYDKNIDVGTKIFLKLITDYLEFGNIKQLELIMKYSGGDGESLLQEETEDAAENSLIAALNRQAEEVWKNESTDKE